MEDLGIDDPVNIAGMGLLIDRNNTKSGYDPSEIEQQIINGSSQPRGREKLSNEFSKEMDKITSEFGAPQHQRDFVFQKPSDTKPFERPKTDIDDILKSLDELDNVGKEENTDMYNTNEVPQIKDEHLEHMTNEEKRQNVIGDVFNDIQSTNTVSPLFSIEKEREEDEKARKLEQINFLLTSLEEEGEDISRIPKVNHTNALDEIDAVLRVLILKNDRKRCCTFAEETILLGAHGLEYAFDGKRSYFGFRPDLVDWHKSVAVKLRRMRHDTSTIVSNIMQAYNLGSGTRLLLELIPSMILYSRMRRSQHKDNMISDDEFNAGINHIRDYEK